MSEPTLEELLPTQNLTDRVVITALLDLRAEVRELRAQLDEVYIAGSECEAEFRARLDTLELEAPGNWSGYWHRRALSYLSQLDDVRFARNEAERELRETREWLRKNGGHVGPCAKWSTPQLACTCGFTEAAGA